MKFYVEIDENVVVNLLIINGLQDVSSSMLQKVLILEDDEYTDSMAPTCIIDISNNGKSGEIVAYKDPEHAKEAFLNSAYDKLSNWPEYSAEDKQSILEQGFEKTSNGSLNILRAY